MSSLGRTLSFLLKNERNPLLKVATLIVVTSFLEAFTVALIFPFLALATKPELVGTGRMQSLYIVSGASSINSFLVMFGTGILALVILTNALGAFTTWTQQRFVWLFEHKLAVRLMRGYLLAPYAFFLQKNSSEMKNTILKESTQIVDGVLEPSLEVLARGVVALAILAVLLVLQPMIGVAALVVMGGTYALLYGFSQRKLRDAGARTQEASMQANKVASEVFGAIKYAKASSSEDFFLHRFDEANVVMAREHAKSALFARLPRYVIEGVTVSLIMGVFIIVLASGSTLVSILPVIGLFAFASFRLIPALHGIVSSAARIQFNDAIVESVLRNLASTEEGLLVNPTDVRPLPFEKEVRFEDVRFTYEGASREILHGVDFTVPKNTSLAIVGRTGAGKTTVLDVFLGLLQPTSGVLKVDGRAVTGADTARWRRNIAYVPQQIVLLDDTVTRNIAFGLPDALISQARVETAAQVAHIHEFVTNELEAGYDTVIGERGIRLSGGQRQRIGIARALYQDPDIVVFDEATSEVDTHTEREINAALQALAGKKTILVVAHRFSSVRNCDQLIVLQDGRVAAAGSYDTLLRHNPLFRTLAEA